MIDPSSSRVPDVYLCFQSRDHEEVDRLAAVFRRQGLMVFLDTETSEPVSMEQRGALLARTPIVFFIVGAAGFDGRQEEVLRQAMRLREDSSGGPYGVIILSTAPRDVPVPQPLFDAPRIDFRSGEREANYAEMVFAVPVPTVAKESAGPFVLAWDPTTFAWADLPGFIAALAGGRRPRSPWSTGYRRTIGEGSEVILFKQQEPPTGIVGWGRVVRGSFQERHWEQRRKQSNRVAFYVEVEWQVLFPEPAITEEELRASFAAPNWDAVEGGTVLEPAVAEQIKRRLEEAARAAYPALFVERTPASEAEVAETPASTLETSVTPASEKASQRIGGSYQVGYAAFASDLVAFDRSALAQPLDDALGVGVYAGHLAQLMTARRTPLPLSLGLFGDWGSGKSYFMRLLHQEIEGLTAGSGRHGDAYCRKVVQIHFNAWHYLDTNLWANLVCEIFDQLFQALTARPDTPEEKIEQLKQRLTEESALAAAAREALDVAKREREKAEIELARARADREQQERTVAATLDNVQRFVAGNEPLQKKLHDVAESLGLDRLQRSYADLSSAVNDVRTLAGRTRASLLTLWTGPGRWTRFAVLGAIVASPLVIGIAVPSLLDGANERLATLVKVITQVTVFVTGVAGWISAQAQRGMNVLNTLDDAFREVTEERERQRSVSGASAEEVRLAALTQREQEAQHVAAAAEERVRAIEEELRELAPGRRLLRFLEERARASDYRQYLGLVSLVRRDFEQLSHLLRQDLSLGVDDQPMLDRIVLYIDDLDRCRADRVVEVLEAVHLILAFPLFAVVVAVDPRWLRRSLLAHHANQLGALAKEGSALAREETLAIASPQDYLEKIFQVPFQLQRMEKRGFEELVDILNRDGFSTVEETAAASTAVGVPTSGTSVDEPVGADVRATSHRPGSMSGDRSLPPEASEQVANPGTPLPSTARREQSETVATVPSPQRLRLESWEIQSIKSCHSLFRTPRAVKRLGNTYSLIRVSVPEPEWSAFLGDSDHPGTFRIPLVMLAVCAGFPAVAKKWIQVIHRAESLSSWIPELTPAVRATFTTWELADLQELISALRAMNADEIIPIDQRIVQQWAARVARYSF
ncbi:MAG TPA: P-loop NTPase fold protein [Opitutaceae bacterium]|nr:P-loop NTPase fold protein [Opitutaceae bacterium]